MNFELSSEQQDIVSAARKFAEGEFQDRAEEFDRNESFDEAIFKKAADLGFVGVFIREKYGRYGYYSDYKVQRFYRDAKITEIYVGTTEIEKIIMARALLNQRVVPSYWM